MQAEEVRAYIRRQDLIFIETLFLFFLWSYLNANDL